MVNEQLKSLLDDKIWHSYRVDLTAFAYKLITDQFGGRGDNDPVLGGMSPADFASNALSAVLTGEEAWDSEKYPKLLTHLFWVVRKHIRKASRRHDNTRVSYAEDDDDFGIDHSATSPVAEAELKEFVDGFLKYLEGDDELQLVAYYMQEGKLKPAEIAQALGVLPSDYTNMRKRLHRKLEDYQKQRRTIKKSV